MKILLDICELFAWFTITGIELLIIIAGALLIQGLVYRISNKKINLYKMAETYLFNKKC